MMADILVKTPSMGKTVKLFSGSVSSGELIKFRESHSESGRLNMCMFLTTAIAAFLSPWRIHLPYKLKLRSKQTVRNVCMWMQQ